MLTKKRRTVASCSRNKNTYSDTKSTFDIVTRTWGCIESVGSVTYLFQSVFSPACHEILRPDGVGKEAGIVSLSWRFFDTRL